MPRMVVSTDKLSQPKRNDGEALRRAIARWKANAASPEYAEAADKVRSAIGKVPKSELLELFEEMEQEYPGRGWHQQAMDLNRHYYTKSNKFDANEYFETIWGLQDNDGMQTHDNPDWYTKKEPGWMRAKDRI